MATGSTSDAWEQYVRDLGVRLHRARMAAGLTQESLAHAAGLTTYTYRKLEKGESNPGTPANPRLRTLAALANACNIPLAQLVATPPDDIVAWAE